MKSPVLRILAVAIAFFSAALLPANENDNAKARQHLDGLRDIQLPTEKVQIDELNKRMDEAWAFIESHKGTLPVVEEELKKAVAAKESDQFFLMDMANLLVTDEGDKAVELALSAVERLDPEAEIIQANWEEVFHLVMKLGASGKEPERYLAQVDRIYLRNKAGVDFFRAPHVVKLTPADLRCMVYGVAGDAAAQHLAAMLGTGGIGQAELVKLLDSLGSEANTPEVKAVMDAASDLDTVAACIGFMMRLGGPSGNEAVLALDPQKMDAPARAYVEEIMPKVPEVTFDTLVSQLVELDPATVSDRKLQGLLDKMEASNGLDNETPPGAVAKSGLPTEKLLAQIKRIRARSFRQETNHVFEDLPIYNMLINALQYKPKEP